MSYKTKKRKKDVQKTAWGNVYSFRTKGLTENACEFIALSDSTSYKDTLSKAIKEVILTRFKTTAAKNQDG